MASCWVSMGMPWGVHGDAMACSRVVLPRDEVMVAGEDAIASSRHCECEDATWDVRIEIAGMRVRVADEEVFTGIARKRHVALHVESGAAA